MEELPKQRNMQTDTKPAEPLSAYQFEENQIMLKYGIPQETRALLRKDVHTGAWYVGQLPIEEWHKAMQQDDYYHLN